MNQCASATAEAQPRSRSQSMLAFTEGRLTVRSEFRTQSRALAGAVLEGRNCATGSEDGTKD